MTDGSTDLPESVADAAATDCARSAALTGTSAGAEQIGSTHTAASSTTRKRTTTVHLVLRSPRRVPLTRQSVAKPSGTGPGRGRITPATAPPYTRHRGPQPHSRGHPRKLNRTWRSGLSTLMSADLRKYIPHTADQEDWGTTPVADSPAVPFHTRCESQGTRGPGAHSLNRAFSRSTTLERTSPLALTGPEVSFAAVDSFRTEPTSSSCNGAE